MTFREWAKAYGGTYATIMFVSMMVSIVVTNEYLAHSLWLHLLIGLPLLLTLQFGLSAVARKFTERRRRIGAGHRSAGDD